MSDVASAPALSAPEPSGIGGWLILPAIALIITPLRMAYELQQTYLPLLKPSLWMALIQSKSSLYNPALATLLAWELIANLTLFVLTIWLGFLFFTKQKRAPQIFIIWMLFNFGVQLSGFLFISFIPMIADQYKGGPIKDLIKTAIATVIWIPYFLGSVRVKNTFVNEPKKSDY